MTAAPKNLSAPRSGLIQFQQHFFNTFLTQIVYILNVSMARIQNVTMSKSQKYVTCALKLIDQFTDKISKLSQSSFKKS